jgi:hypothetical protein
MMPSSWSSPASSNKRIVSATMATWAASLSVRVCPSAWREGRAALAVVGNTVAAQSSPYTMATHRRHACPHHHLRAASADCHRHRSPLRAALNSFVSLQLRCTRHTVRACPPTGEMSYVVENDPHARHPRDSATREQHREHSISTPLLGLQRRHPCPAMQRVQVVKRTQLAIRHTTSALANPTTDAQPLLTREKPLLRKPLLLLPLLCNTSMPPTAR